MPAVPIITAVAAVAGAGASIYSASQAAKGPASVPAPPPASYEQYDRDGNLLTVQQWDPQKNAYVTKFDPKPEKPERTYTETFYRTSGKPRTRTITKPLAQFEKEMAEYEKALPEWEARDAKRRADKELKDGIRTQMLNNIAATPEDRLKAYEDYATSISETLHKDADKQYGRRVAMDKESMEARGMTGSRADVDLAAERGKEKADVDIGIANQARLGAEELAQWDKQYWNNTLSMIENQDSADAVRRYQDSGNAMQQTNAANQLNMAKYYSDMENARNKWQTNVNAWGQVANGLGSIAGAGAYLYGTMNKTPLSAPTSTGSMSPVGQYGARPSWMGNTIRA